MIERIYSTRPARLFIREWMETVPGLDQKRLAERMGVGEGTISKKLKHPEKIDAEWLARFAGALNLQVTDLFRDPAAPTSDQLLARATEEQRREIISFAEFVLSRKTGTDN